VNSLPFLDSFLSQFRPTVPLNSYEGTERLGRQREIAVKSLRFAGPLPAYPPGKIDNGEGQVAGLAPASGLELRNANEAQLQPIHHTNTGIVQAIFGR
jgi:hypothetical protein